MNDQVNIDHEFCLRCGRKLKNPNARAIGYGAVCLRKIKEIEKGTKLFDTDNTKKGLP